jgi:hypothetical protein
MTKEIQLTRNLSAQVDDADFECVNQFRWCAHGGRDGRTWYAKRAVSVGDGKQITMLMHRFILDAPTELQVDHVNHNGLDNRRENLRLCTELENRRNRKAWENSSTGFKGVRWRKNIRKWEATIGAYGTHFYLGCYDTPEQAALAYDIAAIAYHGKFANLNFPAAKLAKMRQPDAQIA